MRVVTALAVATVACLIAAPTLSASSSPRSACPPTESSPDGWHCGAGDKAAEGKATPTGNSPAATAGRKHKCRDVSILDNSGFLVGAIYAQGIGCTTARRYIKMSFQEGRTSLVDRGFVIRKTGSSGTFCGGPRYRASRGAQVISYSLSAC